MQKRVHLVFTVCGLQKLLERVEEGAEECGVHLAEDQVANE